METLIDILNKFNEAKWDKNKEIYTQTHDSESTESQRQKETLKPARGNDSGRRNFNIINIWLLIRNNGNQKTWGWYIPLFTFSSILLDVWFNQLLLLTLHLNSPWPPHCYLWPTSAPNLIDFSSEILKYALYLASMTSNAHHGLLPQLYMCALFL